MWDILAKGLQSHLSPFPQSDETIWLQVGSGVGTGLDVMGHVFGMHVSSSLFSEAMNSRGRVGGK